QQKGHHPRLQAARRKGAVPSPRRNHGCIGRELPAHGDAARRARVRGVARVNPRLVYAQLSGLGYDGPYAGRGGFDLIAQGMGGIMHVTGEPDGPPTSVGLPICDLGTGMWAVQGILAALYERQRTGKGRLVECSLLETAIGFSSWTSAQWLADPEQPTPQASAPARDRPYE